MTLPNCFSSLVGKVVMVTRKSNQVAIFALCDCIRLAIALRLYFTLLSKDSGTTKTMQLIGAKTESW